MAESALRQLVPQSAEPFVRSYNPFNPAFRETMRASISDLLGGRAMGGTPTQRYRANIADMLTGAVEMAPGVGEAVGVTDTRQAIRSGDYGTAAILGGATALGMVPVIGDAASRAIREGLDMSQAARMQRAVEQGFHTSHPLYHSTNASFDAFEIPEGNFLKYGKGVYAAPRPDYSDRYIRQNRNIEEGYKEGANVMPVYVRGKIGTEKDWEQARQEMLAEGVKPQGHNPLQAEIQRRLKEKGFDGLNMFGNETVIFDPANIRSVNAAFDPAKTGSSNLMAGVGGAAVGLSALNQLVPRNEERRPD